MSTDPGSRDERVAARDAARRRISWWTAALAVGGLGGTVAIANEARLVAEDKVAAQQLEQTVSVADDALISGSDGNAGQGGGAETTEPTAAPTTSAASSTKASRRAKPTARATTRRVSYRQAATSVKSRTVRPSTKAPVKAAPTTKRKIVLPTVKSSGS